MLFLQIYVIRLFGMLQVVSEAEIYFPAGCGRAKLQFGRVQKYRHGAVVDEIDFHVRAESAGLDLQTVLRAQDVIEIVV